MEAHGFRTNEEGESNKKDKIIYYVDVFWIVLRWHFQGLRIFLYK